MRKLALFFIIVLSISRCAMAQDSSNVSKITEYEFAECFNAHGGIFIDDVAYVVSPGGLVVLDVSNPQHMSMLQYYPNSGTLWVLSDTLLLCHAINNDRLYNITEPRMPELLLTIHYENEQRGGAVSRIGDYIVTEKHGVLTVTDYANPFEPTVVSNWDADLIWIKTVDNFIFGVSGQRDLSIVDLSDIENPVEVERLNFRRQIGFDISNDYCIVYSSREFFLWNIEERDNPILVNRFFLEDQDFVIRGIWLEDDQVFVYGWPMPYAKDVVRILDISDPESVETITDIELPSVCQGVALADDQLYLYGEYIGISCYDLSDVANPEFVSCFNMDASKILDVAAVNDCYAVANYHAGLRIFDRNGEYLTEVASIPLSARASTYRVLPWDDNSFISFNFGRTSSWFSMIDVSNPVEPTVRDIEHEDNSVEFCRSGDNLVYIDQDTRTLILKDISDRENIHNAGSYQFEDFYYFYSIYAQGDLVFVSAYDVLYILDISDLDNISIASTFEVPHENEYFDKIVAVDDVVYASLNEQWLLIIDVSDPANPERYNSIRTRDNINDICIDEAGEFLYMADGVAGVRIFEVNDPLIPHEVGWYATGEDFTSVYPNGDETVAIANNKLIVLNSATAQPVSGNDNTVLPAFLSLSSPYPNPFNATTRIGFTLPAAGDVNLTVFDASGRMVTTLANGSYPAGTHVASWNAESAATGVYFTQLQANGQQVVKMVNLVK